MKSKNFEKILANNNDSICISAHLDAGHAPVTINNSDDPKSERQHRPPVRIVLTKRNRLIMEPEMYNRVRAPSPIWQRTIDATRRGDRVHIRIKVTHPEITRLTFKMRNRIRSRKNHKKRHQRNHKKLGINRLQCLLAR